MQSPASFKEPTRQWFILNYIKSPSTGARESAAAVVEQFNRTADSGLELFAPTMVRVVCREGKFIKRETPLTFQYVFVRGDYNDIKQLCGMSNGFSFVLNHGSTERYATVTDERMSMFRQIAMAYSNSLPFFDIEDIDLEAGDKVEIVEGSFPGLVGYYMPKAKSGSGDIVLAVTQNLGTIVYDVKARYVRVLEFSCKSRRSYDQIDAFVPKLLRSLRHYSEKTPLSHKEISDLTVFNRRMSQTRIGNNRLETKLLILLAGATFLLGDSNAYSRYLSRLQGRENSINSAASMALLMLIKAVTANDSTAYQAGLECLGDRSDDTHDSHSRRILRAEYENYRTKFAIP